MSTQSLFEDVTWDAFRESSLMRQALTHPSCGLADEHGVPVNNQRLEFLGDSVLGMVVADLLYTLYPHEQEGELARRLSALVCGNILVRVAQSIDLGKALILSPNEEENDGRNNPSNLEDACEALIGALYLDGGYETARAFIVEHWKPLAESVQEPPKDPKTALQEWAQGRGLPLPRYDVIETTGPAHAPEFTIRVSVEGQGHAEAKANAKKHAERLAAAALLERIV